MRFFQKECQVIVPGFILGGLAGFPFISAWRAIESGHGPFVGCFCSLKTQKIEKTDLMLDLFFFRGGYEKEKRGPLFEFRKRKKVAFYWDQRKRGLSRMPFINIPQSRYMAVLDIHGYAFLARFSSHSQVYYLSIFERE